jgi:hypothetical protein
MRKPQTVSNKYNPPAQRYHIESMILQPDAAPIGDASRVYFNHIPQIETGQLVGLFSQGRDPLIFGQSNISNTTTIPTQSQTIDILRGFNNLFVTIVNYKGEVLFNQVPYSTLFPFNGRIKPYNAVNIDSRKCYFSITPGATPTGPLSVQIGFLMQYQPK